MVRERGQFKCSIEADYRAEQCSNEVKVESYDVRYGIWLKKGSLYRKMWNSVGRYCEGAVFKYNCFTVAPGMNKTYVVHVEKIHEQFRSKMRQFVF